MIRFTQNSRNFRARARESSSASMGAGVGTWVACKGHSGLWGMIEGFHILVVVVTKFMELYTLEVDASYCV